jgi:hypothetical protein
MKKALTFIIPVRHPENAKDWNRLKQNLSATVRSIANQTDPDWKAVIAANQGADLPKLPSGFDVAWVDFPANPLYEQGSANKEDFYEAVRADKGRRILAAMLHAGEMSHVMLVDDDDFVSSRLTAFVKEHPEKYGWYIRDGYLWTEGANLLFIHGDFSHLCGSSHIIRADLYKLPSRFEDADENFIRKMLGSHMFIHEHLNASGTPLEPLPFLGAIYRVGHPGAHSKSQGIFQQFIFRQSNLRNLNELKHHLHSLRLITPAIRKEFFGVSS